MRTQTWDAHDLCDALPYTVFVSCIFFAQNVLSYPLRHSNSTVALLSSISRSHYSLSATGSAIGHSITAFLKIHPHYSELSARPRTANLLARVLPGNTVSTSSCDCEIDNWPLYKTPMLQNLSLFMFFSSQAL